MSGRRLRFYGDPALRKRAGSVRTFDRGLRDLAAEMLAIMRAQGGIGLAANQVGEPRRVIVVDLSSGKERDAGRVLVNPVLTGGAGRHEDEEGCLSFPGLRLPVKRRLRVRVEARDLDGNPVIHEARGLFARVLQHEIDHLDGVLFIDRQPILTRLKLLFRLPELKRRYRALAGKTAPPP